MHFNYGTKLAVFQEIMMAKYRLGIAITEEEKVRLHSNIYVKIALKISPNNLTVRHLCLRQLVLHEDQTENIIQQIQKLTYYEDDTYYHWAEGYSYFGYVKDFLSELKEPRIYDIMERINNVFKSTAYERDGMLYPAPFGDTYNEPLEKKMQDTEYAIKTLNDVARCPVIKQVFIGKDLPDKWKKIIGDVPDHKVITTYTIIGTAVGLNNHVQVKDRMHYIDDNGYPVGFNFYTGYQNKYSSKWQEIKDILSWKRIRSLLW